MFEQLTRQLTKLQLQQKSESGLASIEHSLRLLTPLCYLLILARTHLKDFSESGNAASLPSFLLMFTRLPLRSDADLGLDEASSFVGKWIKVILQLGVGDTNCKSFGEQRVNR